MDELLVNGQDFSVASQIPLPKRRSKRWRHFEKLPPEAWQSTFLRTTCCLRRYIASWRIADNKLCLKSIFGRYKLKTNEPLFAEWVTATVRIVDGECVEYVHAAFQSKFEREIVISVVNGAVSPSAVATLLSTHGQFDRLPDSPKS